MDVEREEGAIEVAGDGLGFTVSEDVDALGERFFRVSVGGVVVLGEAGGTGIEADVAPAGVLGFPLEFFDEGATAAAVDTPAEVLLETFVGDVFLFPMDCLGDALVG